MSNNKNKSDKMDVDENNNNDNDDNEGQEIEETESEREERALKLKADGNKKYSAKQYKEAINLYSQAIDAYPRPEFYGNRAAACIAIHDFEPALKDCLSAIKLDAKFRKAYIRGTKCYTEMAQFDDAKQFAQRGLEQFPNDKEIKQGYDRVGILENKLNRINKKLEKVSLKYDSMFESHIKANSSSINLNYSNNTNNTNNTNKNDVEDLKEEKEKEKSKNNHYNKILHKLSSDDSKEVDIAISMISSLLNNDLSQSMDLKCTNIRALIIKQNYDSALSTATNILRWNKNNINVTKLRAIALFRNGNSDSAIKHLQNILRKDPDNKSCKSLFKLFKTIGRSKDAGNKAFKSGDLDVAITKYTECLLLDRTNLKFNSVIYANRAAVWLKKKEWQNAYDDCTSSIELNNGYLKSYCRRVQSLYGLERYDEAVADAEAALKLDPSSTELRQQLRQSKIELKKSKRKNYYKILGTNKEATEKEIKKAFRKKAMVWHPDKFASKPENERKKAEETFKEIGEAYEVLKDPKMRQRYDAGADLDEIKQGSHGFHGGNVDISHIFDLLGGMGGGGMGGGMPHGFSSSGGHGHGGQQQFSFRFG